MANIVVVLYCGFALPIHIGTRVLTRVEARQLDFRLTELLARLKEIFSLKERDRSASLSLSQSIYEEFNRISSLLISNRHQIVANWEYLEYNLSEATRQFLDFQTNALNKATGFDDYGPRFKMRYLLLKYREYFAERIKAAFTVREKRWLVEQLKLVASEARAYGDLEVVQMAQTSSRLLAATTAREESLFRNPKRWAEDRVEAGTAAIAIAAAMVLASLVSWC